jgi:hypothetical protein
MRSGIISTLPEYLSSLKNVVHFSGWHVASCYYETSVVATLDAWGICPN